MNIEIQILTEKDTPELTSLISVFEVVFEMDPFVYPDKKYLSGLLSNRSFIAVTARLNGKVIAGLTAYVLDQYYSTKPLAYIYDLAVLAEYQRQGVGRQLMDFFNSYCREKGFEEVFVQADKEDDHAIDFYRSTQPTREDQAVQFSYSVGS
ncbi:MAG: GNAT family N-acetyltransferase [Bacteroidia bacterium]